MAKLLYLEDMNVLHCHLKIKEIISQDDRSKIIILDQTVFYPQGGGQPSDKGIIVNEQAKFEVQTVFKHADLIYHEGNYLTGFFIPGQKVELFVDKELRTLHNKNHTAGHLIDCALYNLKYFFEPIKAYHFPQGPYVEYKGTIEQSEKEILVVLLEQEVNKLIQQSLSITITLINNDSEKRAMIINSYEPIFCGGTHVSNTSEVGHVKIRKIKNEKGNLRVSYAVD